MFKIFEVVVLGAVMSTYAFVVTVADGCGVTVVAIFLAHGINTK